MCKAASCLELANIYIRQKTFNFFRSAVTDLLFGSSYFWVLLLFPLLA